MEDVTQFVEYQALTRTTAAYSDPSSEEKHMERLWHLGDERLIRHFYNVRKLAETADAYKKWIRDGKIMKRESLRAPLRDVSYGFVGSAEGAPKATFDMSVQQIYVILGLISEVGEVAELFHEAVYNGKPPEFMQRLRKELGDVLWYVSEICTEHGLDMGGVARDNLKKLQDRKERGQIHGSGDDR
jgi:NTP pyrophosphatase (non-canonical NTP hydrolase)